MFGVDPFGEGHDHVHQHLVAIGDDERAVHAAVPSSLWAAAAMLGGRHLQRVGAGDKVVFVGGEERQDRRERRLLSERGAQLARRKPGQAQQSFGARFVAQNPAERLKRQRGIAIVQVACPFVAMQLCRAADSPKRAAHARWGT